jgi:hypothetical protein
VPTRVSPTDRIRCHIDDLFAQDRPLPEILEEVARLGAQLLMQAALEAEVTEFLGRDRYAPDGLRLLQDLRRSLLDPPARLRPSAVTAARPGDHPETVGATA